MTSRWFLFLRSKRGDEVALHVALSISLMIGICFLLGLGPQIQFYLLAAIESPEVNLYATAYQDTLIAFPKIVAWLAEAAWYPFILAALAILVATYRSGNARELFIYVALTCFIALMVIDFVGAIAAGSITLGFVTKNLFFNFAGALIVAGFVLFSCTLVDLLLLYTSLQNPKVLTAAYAACPAFLGIWISVLTYYAVDFVYSPKRVKIEVVSEVPFDAWFSSRGFNDFNLRDMAPDNPTGESLSPSFGIFSRPKNVAMPFGLVQLDEPWRLSWMRTSPELVKISIGFYSNCIAAKSLSALAKNSLPLNFYDANELGVAIENGQVSFSGNLGNSESARIYIRDDGMVHQLRIENSKMPNRYYVNQYTEGATSLHYWDESGAIVFAVGVSLFKELSKGGLVPAEHIVSLRINSREYKIQASPSSTSTAREVSKCHLIRNQNILNSGLMVVNDAGAEFGLMIKIDRPNTQTVYSSSEQNQITVETKGAVFGIDGLKAEDLGEMVLPGSVGFFAITGQRVHFRLNGRDVSTIGSQTYAMKQSKLLLRLDSAPSLVVSGRAGEAFADSTRLNETRWEQLDSSVRFSIFAGLITLVLTLIGMVGKLLHRNEVVYWTSL